MKTILSILGFTFIFFASLAQPNTWQKPYRTKYAQEAKYYNSQAKSFAEKGQHYQVALNAANALSNALKKRHIVKAQNFLRRSYPIAIRLMESRIEALQEEPEQYTGHETVNTKYEIWKLYKELDELSNVLLTVPKASFKAQKRKQGDLRLEIKEYRSQVSKAKAALDISKKKTAEFYYQKGLNFFDQEGMENQRTSARSFRLAYTYIPNYKEAKSHYKEAKQKGTIRLGVIPFENSQGTRKYGDVGEELSNKIIASFFTDVSRDAFEFFELISRDQLDLIIKEQKLSLTGLFDESTVTGLGGLSGVHYILVGKVTSIETDRQRLEPSNSEVKREVVIRKETYTDSNGDKKTRNIKGTVTAIVTTYVKHASASVNCNYKILDVATGAYKDLQAATGSYRFENKWGVYKGDERALGGPLFPSKEYKLVRQREKPYPSNSELINGSTNDILKNITPSLHTFAKEVGQ